MSQRRTDELSFWHHGAPHFYTHVPEKSPHPFAFGFPFVGPHDFSYIAADLHGCVAYSWAVR